MKKINFTLKLKALSVLVLGLLVSSNFGTVQAQCTIDASASNLPLSWPAGTTSGVVNANVTVADVPCDEQVTSITVDFAMSHTFAGDLEISLIAPTGQEILMVNNACGSSDFAAGNTITFDDAGGAYLCANPVPAQVSAPLNAIGGLVFANTSELNGNWMIEFNDTFGGDTGTIGVAAIHITTSGTCGATDCGQPTCEITCPTDQVINLDPGLCCQVYSWEIETTDLCGTLAIEGFVGPYAPGNTFWEINTPTADPNQPGGGNPSFQADCGMLTETEMYICGRDNFTPPPGNVNGENDCVWNFTGYYWEAPESGTISFDWDYSSNDFDAFWDPFTWVEIDMTQPIPNILSNNLIFGPFGAVQGAGSFSIPVFAGQIIGLNVNGDGIDGAACVTVTNHVFTPNNLLVINQISGPESGTCLDIENSPHEFEVEVIGADGTTATCAWTVEVAGFPNPTTTLACNDNVQVSVDENCMAYVSTDMILEGGPYACYDEYLVAIETYGEELGGVEIDGAAVGQQLGVTITDPATGNSCWGYINVEDKLDPMITCDTITLPCGVSTEPVNTPPSVQFLTVPGSPNAPIDNPLGSNLAFDIDIPVAAPAGFQVIDVDIALDITHAFSADLEITLTGPGGQSVVLADGVCGAGDDWDVTFDDDGGPVVCAGTPVLSGTVAPAGSLADLNGLGASGSWTLSVQDNFGGCGGGMLNNFTLYLELEELQATEPIATDNCDPDPELTYTDNESGDDCEGGQIERTWTATDASGNTATCVQIINLIPLDLGALACPDAYVGDYCWESTHPDNTGYPTVGGVEIDGGSLCNIFLDYWDKPLTACGNGTKIIRTWTVLDWCTQDVEECIQVIKLPAEGPALTCPDNHTVGADPWYCDANVNLPYPSVSEECGGANYTLVPTSSNGVIVYFNGYYRVDGLPLGETVITWTAEDECDNSSTCSYTITVVDNVPPVPLCDEHTIVSLTFDGSIDHGLTKVPAEVFDDGSYDNCGPVTLTARRVTSCIDFDWTTNGACVDATPNIHINSADKGTAFGPCVPFVCCDVNAGPIMVELRVQDSSLNVNFCMVEITVQDKLDPYITPPPSVDVSCDFWFAVEETGGSYVPQYEDPLTPVFGRVLDAYEYDQSDRQYVVIDDPGSPLSQPYNWGLEGWADDNCNVEVTVRVQVWEDCSGDNLSGKGAPVPPYATRLVKRTFKAEDGQGNSSTAAQFIWVIDYDPFEILDWTCVNQYNDGVIWPCDETYGNCPIGGIVPNYPTIFDDNCSLIGVTYEDTRFDFVDDVCYKILREWTVIDWCQYESHPEEQGIWRYIQVIKVIDSEGPQADAPPVVELCAADSNVSLPANNQVFLGENNPLASSCSVHIILEHEVSDFCSDEITYDVKFYPNNDPSYYMQVLKKTTISIDTTGTGTMVFDSRSSSLLGVRLNGLDYNSPYCSNWPSAGGSKDYHRVLWSMEDGCGNTTTLEYLLRLEDCKAPSPVCVSLSSVVMPSSGEVTIWASDFNASSFDDCTPAADLLYSFSGDSYQPSRSFDCAAIEENGGTGFPIEIWVADKGNDQNCNGFRSPNQNMGILDGIEWSERNKDFCSTWIIIDDNTGVCGGPLPGSSAGGAIQTEEQDPVELVTVNLKDNNGNVVRTYTTSQDGLYHFINPLLDLDMEPVRNDDPMNGVSTLDLVNIQKHLLGIEDLGTPYKLIAADANNSQSVSAIDLVELRKLILGLYTELPNNESWRFVDGEYVFPDATNPWNFTEVINIQDLTMGNDFVAVKIGDVNGTVAANATSIETRNTNGVLSFEATEQSVEAGQEVVVDVRSDNFENIIGYQFTMRTEGLTLINVETGAIDMGAENVGVHKSALTASWHRIAPVSVNADDVLYTMTFTATQSGSLSEMLSVSSRLTAAEAYDGAEDILDVALTFTNENLTPAGKDFALFQNSPNPFNGETVVAFTLPEAMEANMTVFDVTGKVVYSVEGDYAAGYNQVTISSSDLSATGVLYYRLDADEFTATKKMVLID